MSSYLTCLIPNILPIKVLKWFCLITTILCIQITNRIEHRRRQVGTALEEAVTVTARSHDGISRRRSGGDEDRRARARQPPIQIIDQVPDALAVDP